jgi:4-hydroxy-tetrahydrodipicolinate reductase
MIKIGIFGYNGRMGQLIAEEVAAHEACTLAGGLVRSIKPDFKKPEEILITTNPDELAAISDILIDVTIAESTPSLAAIAAAHGKPFMCCTTGLTPDAEKTLADTAKKIPVLHGTNTSLSLAAMRRVVELAANLLGDFDYDVVITEEHHRMKKDAPSGTAKTLGAAVTRGNDGKKTPTFHSIRAGGIVGDHEVVFAGQGETIRLRHSVTDRRIFARGAVQAALWLHNKPSGLYGMEDVLGV